MEHSDAEDPDLYLDEEGDRDLCFEADLVDLCFDDRDLCFDDGERDLCFDGDGVAVAERDL